MKNILRNTIILAFVLCGCAIVGTAQNPPMVGGYRAIETTDERADAAAAFAIGAQSEKTGVEIILLAITKAERQTVQGANYRLCLNVETGGEEQTVKVVVYQDLKGNYKLTSWKEEQCGQD